MKATRRAALPGVLALVWLAGYVSLLAVQGGAAVARPVLTPAQMEDFLLHAKIIDTKGVSKGVTNTRRATLSDGQVTHDAQVQTVDISKALFQPDRGPSEMNFKDSYRFNIAAYRLALLLRLDNVPMSVERRVQSGLAAVTWWIDDVVMDEGQRRKKQAVAPDSRTAGWIHIMRVFDELISNSDRNAGNTLWTADGKMWMIDHTRTFRYNRNLRNPKLLERCERGLLERMRGLTAETLRRELDDSVSNAEIEPLLARRDEIVKLFEGKIAQRGESAILYTLPQS